MSRTSPITRRDALKAAATAAVPLVLPGHLFGADAPSKKITVASDRHRLARRRQSRQLPGQR